LPLGSLVTPERRLRVAARRPIAELAVATGAAVSLSATVGGDAVILDAVEAREPLGFAAEPGARVPAGTAQARAHTEIGRSATIVDAGGVLVNLSCVAVAVPLGGGEVAAVSAVITGIRPSAGLLAATRASGARIAGRLRAPLARDAATAGAVDRRTDPPANHRPDQGLPTPGVPSGRPKKKPRSHNVGSDLRMVCGRQTEDTSAVEDSEIRAALVATVG